MRRTSNRGPGTHPADTAQPSRAVTLVAIVGGFGVAFYIATWLVAGFAWDGYDPARQAISELFAIGAPGASRVALSISLVVSGMALVAFGWALPLGLAGSGRLGQALATLSGVMTIAVAAFPCSAGCPGFGTTFTDSMHVTTAGTGYVALMLTPIAVGWRLRRRTPGLAWVSWGLGGGALTLFLVRTLGFAPSSSGLQQRIFNTTADLWYLVVAVVIIARRRRLQHPS